MLDKTREHTITTSLEKCGSTVTQAGHGQWTVALSNGTALHAVARVDDEWLLFDAPLQNGTPCGQIALGDAWRLLRWNAEMSGAKFAVLPGELTARVRAELPLLDDDVHLPVRVRGACAGLKMASARFYGAQTEEQEDEPQTMLSTGDVQDTTFALPCLCDEAGWPYTPRADGSLAVTLDTRGGFYQAMLVRHGRSVHVTVDLIVCGSLPQPCRDALGIVLLTVSGLVRMVRATAIERGDRIATCCEVTFTDSLSAAELGHALTACSIACRLCGQEVNALQDEEIARTYLDVVRGGAS